MTDRADEIVAIVEDVTEQFKAAANEPPTLGVISMFSALANGQTRLAALSSETARLRREIREQTIKECDAWLKEQYGIAPLTVDMERDDVRKWIAENVHD